MRWAGILLALALVGACGDDGDDASENNDSTTTTRRPPACIEVQESLDPGSGQHLLPGAPEPSYVTDPPTSGAHSTTQFPTGKLEQPIARPVQVRMLEEGLVLIQHQQLAPAEQADLDKLANPEVAVAPNPNLAAPVIATAWTWKLTCQRVDVTAIGQFIAARGSVGAPHD